MATLTRNAARVDMAHARVFDSFVAEAYVAPDASRMLIDRREGCNIMGAMQLRMPANQSESVRRLRERGILR